MRRMRRNTPLFEVIARPDFHPSAHANDAALLTAIMATATSGKAVSVRGPNGTDTVQKMQGRLRERLRLRGYGLHYRTGEGVVIFWADAKKASTA